MSTLLVGDVESSMIIQRIADWLTISVERMREI